MKHTTSHSLMIFAALAGSATLRAQDSVQLPIQRVCDYARSRSIQVKTANGDTVEGVCFSTSVNEIQVKTQSGVIKIARAQLARVTVTDIPRHHQLRLLGKHVGQGISKSAKMIPTEAGLAGIIGIPTTLAWGAVAVPFCLFGDIIGYAKTIEVKIL